MNRKITFFLVLITFTQMKVAAQYSWSNVNLFGGASSAGTAIRASEDGPTTLYTAGSYDGTQMFGSYSLSCTGNNAGFAARIDNGVVAWAKSFGGSSSSCDVVDVLQYNGFVYVVGNYTFYMQAGSLAPVYAAGGYDIFLLIFDGTGNYFSLKTYGGPQDDNVVGLVQDSNGDLYLAGSFSGTSTFDAATITSAGLSDAFLVKMDAIGTTQWAKKAGGAGYDGATGIALLNDMPYINGTFKGSNVMFGTNSLSITNNDYGVFLAKYDGSGTNLFASKITQCANLTVRNLAVGGDRFFMCGLYVNNLNIGGTILPGNNGADIFVAAFDSTGLKQWAKKGGSAQFADEVSYIAGESKGYCSIVGSNNSPISFGGVTVSQTSYTEVYAFGFDLNGATLFGLNAAGPGFQRGGFVKQKGINTFLYGGMMESNANFSGNVFTSPGNFASFFTAEVSLGTLSTNEQAAGNTLFNLYYIDKDEVELSTEEIIPGTMTYIMRDLAGRIILTGPITDGRARFSTLGIGKGIYTVEIVGKAQNAIRKFLVQ